MEVIFNTIIQPIFKVDKNYCYRYNNNFYQIENKEIIDILINLFDKKSVWDFNNLANAIIKRINMTSIEVYEILKILLEHGIITQKYTTNRYTTNLMFFSLFDNLNKKKYQDILSNSEVCVLGLGGSTLLIQQFAWLGIKKITGIDFDVIEEKNLNRQVLFKESNIGQLKNETLQKNVQEINSSIEYDFLNIYMKTEDDIIEIIKTADIVLLALDEPIIDSEMYVHKACKQQKKPLISSGVWGDIVTYMWFDYRNEKYPCYQCYLKMNESNIVANNYFKAIKGKSFSNFNTTTIFTASILAGVTTTELVKILTQYTQPFESGNILQINTSNWNINIEKIEKQNECSFCKTGLYE